MKILRQAAFSLLLTACASGPPEPVSLQQVSLAHPRVQTSGTAHYPVRVKQVVKNGFLGTDDTVWLYPLFPPGDVSSRAIRAMVLDPREPDPILGFEDRSFAARVEEPSDHLVSPRVQDAFKAAGYTFEDGWLVLLVQSTP